MGRGLIDPARTPLTLLDGRRSLRLGASGCACERSSRLSRVAAGSSPRSSSTAHRRQSSPRPSSRLEPSGSQARAPNLGVDSARGRRRRHDAVAIRPGRRSASSTRSSGGSRRVVRVRLLPFVFLCHDAVSMVDPGERTDARRRAQHGRGPAASAERDARRVGDAQADSSQGGRRTRQARKRSPTRPAMSSRSRCSVVAGVHAGRTRTAVVTLEDGRPPLLARARRSRGPTGASEWFWRGIELPESLVQRLPGHRRRATSHGSGTPSCAGSPSSTWAWSASSEAPAPKGRRRTTTARSGAPGSRSTASRSSQSKWSTRQRSPTAATAGTSCASRPRWRPRARRSPGHSASTRVEEYVLAAET